MASACLNTIGLSPDHLPPKYSSYGWFSPRLSISDASKSENNRISSANNRSNLPEVSDPANDLSDLPEESDTKEFDGFEFRLEDPVIMLPADELFSDGKLVPLHFSVIRQEVATSTTTIISGVVSPDTPYSRRRTDDAFSADPYLYSPRAPRCSSRWKELLGFGKVNHSSNHTGKVDNKRSTVASSQNITGATRSIRQLLYRSSKSSNDSPINLPLLKDSDNESVTVSSRPSLSSSSSGHDIDDLPRLSLDSDKHVMLKLNRRKTRPPSSEAITVSTRVGRSTLRRPPETTLTVNRGLSVDSPRINSSGKIVFHSLEHSSSSPSSFNGGPRFKPRGMERSYSGNVRVLNVPVVSLRSSSKSGGMFGFSMFSSQHKREASSGSNSNSNNGGSNRGQRFNAAGKSRTDYC